MTQTVLRKGISRDTFSHINGKQETSDKQQFKKLVLYWNVFAEILDSVFLWIMVATIFQPTTMFKLLV